MKVLFVCSAGMSSSMVADELKNSGNKEGIDIEIKAVGAAQFEDEVKNGYDCSLVAPQVRHMFNDLKKSADAVNVPCGLIEPRAYSRLGGPKLLAQVKSLMGLY